MATLVNVPRARAVLQREGLDGAIGCTPENVYYLSGGLESTGFAISRYTTQVFAIVNAERPGDPIIVSGLGDAGAILLVCPRQTRAIHYGTFFRYVDPEAKLDAHEIGIKARVVDTPAKANAFEGLLAGLEEARLTRGRVGYDEKGFDATHLPRLREKLPQLELVPAWATIRGIRAVKTDEEIRRLTATLRLTERAIQEAITVAAPGVTEEDLIREYRRAVVSGGGTPAINEITFGRRAAVGSLPRQNGVLKEGDIIRFDVGCKLDGYWSDIARLFAFRGEPPARIRGLYGAMVAGEEHAIRIMRPGITAREVFKATVAAVRAAGAPHYDRHHVGHAIGLEVYEVPLLGPGDETPLEAGMVFEVETPYYEIGFAGVQIEDTVIVREGGGEMITTLPRGIEPLA